MLSKFSCLDLMFLGEIGCFAPHLFVKIPWELPSREKSQSLSQCRSRPKGRRRSICGVTQGLREKMEAGDVDVFSDYIYITTYVYIDI